MTEETLDRANELHRSIRICERALDEDTSFGYFYKFLGKTKSYEFGTDDLNKEIKFLIKRKLSEYKQELENL